MRLADVEGFISVRRWLMKLSKKSGSEQTKRNYLLCLRRFCEYAGMTPDEMVEERERLKEIKNQIEKREKKMENKQ